MSDDLQRAEPDEARPPRTVVAYIPDLFFNLRVADVVKAQGGESRFVDSADALWDALAAWPALVLIDMQAPGDWLAVVRRAKNLPHMRLIPVVAFGSHVDTDALKAARLAGCDHAWAKSRFVEQLPALVKTHLERPPQYVEGWDDRPSALALRGFATFNAGHYWEQHELLEAVWLAETRPVREMYQGILQVGVALLQIEEGKWAGAVKLLRRGLNRLDTLPPRCMGVDLATFRRQAHLIHHQLLEVGEDGLAAVDRDEFPVLIYDESASQPDADP